MKKFFFKWESVGASDVAFNGTSAVLYISELITMSIILYVVNEAASNGN